MEASPDIAQLLGRVEGKVDLLVDGMTKHFDNDKADFATLHKKLDGLKTKWAYAAGAAAVITFMVSHLDVVSALSGILPK
jgi:hypothetical protein